MIFERLGGWLDDQLYRVRDAVLDRVLGTAESTYVQFSTTPPEDDPVLWGERFTDSFGQVMRVHEEGSCMGDYCTIHDPSDHHMREWDLLWRGDRGIFERQCQHGVGHPDPDMLDFTAITQGIEAASVEGVHGCDGCCAPTGS